MKTMAVKGEEPLAAVRSYAQAFETLEPQRVVPYYDEPSLIISPEGSVALPAHADVQAIFERLMGDLRKQGYASSELAQLEEARWSDTLAMVTGRVIWRKADGAELRRFEAAYILRKTNDAWRIAVAAFHAGLQ
jgi:ketosteroid isomerase-like protein